jgi:hypothetical protein
VRRLAFAALIALAAPLFATPPIMTPPPPAAPPALTVVIAVDGLSSNIFDRYRPGFAGGFARLGTGARFSLEGGGTYLGGLSGAIDRGRPGSQTLVVSAFSSLVDPDAEQSWIFASGRFEQASVAPAPAIAAQGNAAIAQAIATAQSALDSPPECASPPLASGGKRFARAGGDLAAYVASPQADGGTLAFALALARDLGLGSTSQRADVVAIGLGATGAIAATHGAASQELCLGLFSLDRDLGDAFAYLDRTGVDYAVVLAGVSTEPAPLLFWRKGWSAPATGGPARAADIVPTIAAMVGAPIDPASAPGSCLSGMPGIICPAKR